MEAVANRVPTKKKKRIKESGVNHFRTYPERPFLKEERPFTTMLIGGLSPTHDYLIEAAFRNLGLKAKMLPPTNIEAFHIGREYGNNGYCNPAYFTVGNLIRFLRKLESEGVPKEELIENYVFFTIGCNAPCRFGMLETEYRMALKDCGYEGFRVLAFENEGGLNQKTTGNGVEVNPEFFLGLVNAINLADVLNELVYYTRPYEVKEGSTDRAMEEAKAFLYDKLLNKKRILLKGNREKVANALGMTKPILFLHRFIDQITSDYYTEALLGVRKIFEKVEVDRFRPRTRVKITGEFWAMTTVGAGNFNMFEFLEREGAELLIEPVASLIQFLFSKGLLRHRNKRQVVMRENVEHWWQIRTRLKNYIAFQKKLTILKLGNFLYRREYKRLLDALGGDNHMLIDQRKLQKLGNPYYNINIEGGEGYMEIAKNIYYHKKKRAHMVLSLKPFGCMPSTQSDGAQAAVIEHNKDIIFLPLETAGDGETNAQSRALMSLGDARAKAKQELRIARDTVLTDIDEMKRYVARHPELKSPFYLVPSHNGTISRAANFLYHIDYLVHKEQVA